MEKVSSIIIIFSHLTAGCIEIINDIYMMVNIVRLYIYMLQEIAISTNIQFRLSACPLIQHKSTVCLFFSLCDSQFYFVDLEQIETMIVCWTVTKLIKLVISNLLVNLYTILMKIMCYTMFNYFIKKKHSDMLVFMQVRIVVGPKSQMRNVQ